MEDTLEINWLTNALLTLIWSKLAYHHRVPIVASSVAGQDGEPFVLEEASILAVSDAILEFDFIAPGRIDPGHPVGVIDVERLDDVRALIHKSA
jgi:hypothetical protein